MRVDSLSQEGHFKHRNDLSVLVLIPMKAGTGGGASSPVAHSQPDGALLGGLE